MAAAEEILEAELTMEENKTALEERVEHIQSDVSGIRKDLRRIEDKVDDNYQRLDEKIDTNCRRLDEKIDTTSRRLEEKIDGKFEKLAELLAKTNANVASIAGAQKATMWAVGLIAVLVGGLFTLVVRALP